MADKPVSRAEKARLYHPAMWARVRGACRWASSEVDLDDHAAAVVELVNRALGRRGKR